MLCKALSVTNIHTDPLTSAAPYTTTSSVNANAIDYLSDARFLIVYNHRLTAFNARLFISSIDSHASTAFSYIASCNLLVIIRTALTRLWPRGGANRYYGRTPAQ